jgi:hypothetical protein
MAQDEKRPLTPLGIGLWHMRPNRPFYELLRRFPPGTAARSIALGLNPDYSRSLKNKKPQSAY